MKKPTVAIYAAKDYIENGAPAWLDEYYRDGYENLLRFILHFGGEIIVAENARETYVEENKFRDFWRVKIGENEKIFYEKVENSPAEFHILFDKGRFPFDISRKINSNKLRRICDNKYWSYLFAPDFHAKCFLLENSTELKIFARSRRKNEKIALKELDAHGGKRVFVGEIANYAGNLNFPILAQEFIDTSGGFENLARGIHDVRVILFDGKPIHGLLREPRRKNEFRANFALGGFSRELFVREIPEELIEKTREIDARFSARAPRFFSADWGFDRRAKKWKMFEINKSPGMANVADDGDAGREFLELLAENLVNSARKNMKN